MADFIHTSAVNWTPNTGLGEIIMASAIPGVSLPDLHQHSFPPTSQDPESLGVLNLLNAFLFMASNVGRLMVNMPVKHYSIYGFVVFHNLAQEKHQHINNLLPRHVMFATRRNNFCDSGPSTIVGVFGRVGGPDKCNCYHQRALG